MSRFFRILTVLLPLGLLFWQGETVAHAQARYTHEAATRPRRPPPVLHPARTETRHRPQYEALPLPLPPPPPPSMVKAEPKAPAKAVAHVAAKPKKPPPPPPNPNKGTSTGLPLPRFAALRTDEVNLRTGPGMRYPIEWVYKRRYLPVEIEREFDVWRLVALPDGTRGWVNSATLIGRRTFDVGPREATLRAQPEHTAVAVAVLKPGVIGLIRSCAGGSAWCRVQVRDYGGYLRRDEIWGTLPNEVVKP